METGSVLLLFTKNNKNIDGGNYFMVDSEGRSNVGLTHIVCLCSFLFHARSILIRNKMKCLFE